MVPAQNYITVVRRPPDIEDYIDMIRRYRSWILGPAFAGLVVSVVAAFFWPDVYVSSAVMRITPQQIPERLVPSTMTSQIAERLQAMQTDILSRGRLQELIRSPTLDLYKRDLSRKPMQDVVEEMRRNIRIDIVDMPSAQTRSRVAQAFRISFSYDNRYKAQAVVSALVTMFTEQNATVLRNQANTTAEFLGEEATAAEKNLKSISEKITQFKMENQGRLPEQLQANLATLTALQQQLNFVNETISRNGAEKLMLETQLQQLKQSGNFIAANMSETVASEVSKNERLNQLSRTILDAELQLAAARETYRDDHPDIRKLKSSLQVLKRERDSLTVAQQQVDAANPAGPTTKSNPRMLQAMDENKSSIAMVQAQIQAKELEVKQRIERQVQLNKEIQAYSNRIEVAPAKEERYAELTRNFDAARSRYEEMTRKKELSATAQNLEERNAGENLDVLDPASLPEQPTDPNRLVIAATGTGLGVLAGLFLSGMKEMKDTSLKNLKDVRAYTNLPVLSSVPLLENALLVRRKRRLFWLAWSSAIIVGTGAMSGSMYYYYFGRG